MKLLSIFDFQNLKQTAGFVASKIGKFWICPPPLLDSCHDATEADVARFLRNTRGHYANC